MEDHPSPDPPPELDPDPDPDAGTKPLLADATPDPSPDGITRINSKQELCQKKTI